MPTTAPAASSPDASGSVVRFSTEEFHVDVVIAPDDTASRDFLSMLPLTLRFEEFNRREKISYLPRPLDTSGAAGSDPDDGDLIYYTPWGNLGFYYDATGIEYSDQVIHLGTFNATGDQLAALEGRDVTVDIVA